VRRPIEKLAWLLWVEANPDVASISDLATRYGETTDRILDALDVTKIARGEPSLLPPLDWSVERRGGRP
jgi:hypothetical protein